MTPDPAGNMGIIARQCFPGDVQITDTFHVPQLATQVLQEIRIKHQCEALDNENQRIGACKNAEETYFPEILCNGNTIKQLLSRSRYLLYKSEHQWTQELSWIFNSNSDKIYAFRRLAKWADKVEHADFKSFNTVSRTINTHHKRILNCFDKKNTNASAES
ncbi:transposase [Sphingobacterium sp. UBA7855]|uniref:transposase n=1 Tax=Sphingobacterium sp. UBA7855 TaxID=1947526 RepID=UPI0025D58746|nr:transposase [Sphingobacterium sp. UBA7855]